MPIPEGEADALRRCLSILARHAEPHERMNMARRVEQRISGDDTGILAYTYRHLAVLFYPSSDDKAKTLEAAMQAARAANELTSMLPPDQGRITLADLAIWPDCPPLPPDSPLKYWLPGIAIEKAAPHTSVHHILQNSVMVEAIMRFRFPLMRKAAAAVSVTSLSSGSSARRLTVSPEYMSKANAEKHRLEAMTHAALSAEHQQVQEEIADRARAEAEAREAAMPFNQPAAMADFAYWASMGHWALDETVALLLGRDPSKVSWSTIQPYTKISQLAQRYERLRNLALRAPELAYGQHAAAPMTVISWATDIGHLVPLELAAAVAARETKRLSRETAALKGNLGSREPPARAEASTTPREAQAAKSAGEIAAMNWGYVCEELRRTPGPRAALLLEFMRSIRARSGEQLPGVVTIGGREFEVNSSLLDKLELLPNIDAALVDATNPRTAVQPKAHDLPTAVVHKVRRRADPLAAFISAAKTAAGPSADWAGIWAEMVVIAQDEKRPAPVLGYVEGEGVKYQSDRLDSPITFLTREAWRKRFERSE